MPLLERVKLCGIVASNLDEFYAVRVAGLLAQIESAVRRRFPDGRTPARTLTDVRARARALQAAQEALWFDELRPALAAEGIRIVSVDECTGRELRSLTKRFRREIEPLLTPIAVGAAAPFPLLPSLALNIGVIATDGVKAAPRFIRVNVPDDLPRFIEVGSNGARVAIEDAILHFLPTVVAGDEIGHTVFRITRDADFSVSGDADDLLEAVETQLLRRRFGDVVRLEVAAAAPTAARRPARAPASHRRRAGLYAARAARPARGGPAVRDRSARPEGQALEGDHATAVHEEEPRRAARADPPPRRARPPSVRLVRRERRRVRKGGARPEGRRVQGDRLPDRRLVADALVTRADGRAGEAGRVPRRAEGAIRRAAQHRVVAGARTSGRRHRLRRPGPEDPREARAARQARAERPAPLRPHRHRELPLVERVDLRGPGAVHRGPGHRRGCRRRLQRRHRSLAPGRVPQAARRAVVPPRRDPAGDRAGVGRRASGRAGADPPEGQLARRRGDHRGAVRRVDVRA